MTKSIILIFSFLPLSISAQDLFWEKFRSELLIHVGGTGYRTKKDTGTKRDNTTQLGYDIKFGYELGNFQPFIKLHGHWVLATTHTKAGLGTYWFFKKSEFQFDFSRKREKFLDIDGEEFEGDIVIYKMRLLWSYPIKQFENFQLRSLIGGGVNTHGERKIFKFNRGEYYMAGIRFFIPDEHDVKESFVTELYWQQDVIRSSSLRQERNSFILRFGKRF